MSGRIDWKLYTPRLKAELTGMAGVLSAAGGTIAGAAQGLAAVGWIVATGPFAIALTAGGLGLAGLSLAVGFYRAIPPKKRSAAELNAKTITVGELLNLHPSVLKVGVVGDSRAGKTTLIRRILQQPPPRERTQGVSAYIAALQTTPVMYIGLLNETSR